ncbi:MAG: hypothetical protein J6C81_09010 [Muribaculaceae bacterium]|nr:hypothetical protein [Muribaculaceae bacterium]
MKQRTIISLGIAILMIVGVAPVFSTTASTTEKTRKTAVKKSGTRTKAATAKPIATFTIEGETFQLLPKGKVKCTSNAKWYGSYEKETEHAGYSAYSPEIDWYIISLVYSGADGEYLYLIYDDVDVRDKVYELAAGSVGFDISVDPIAGEVTITTDDDPDNPETHELDQLNKVGKVTWLR